MAKYAILAQRSAFSLWSIEKKLNLLQNHALIMSSSISIPLEKAVELCKAHRDKHGVRMFSQCWGCVRFSKGVPEKMCFYKPANNDGCKFVNELFESSN
jgi:hypothetical protein